MSKIQHVHFEDDPDSCTESCEEHYYQWGSRAAGGQDICICGRPRGKCPEPPLCNCPSDGLSCPHCGRTLEIYLPPDHMERCHRAAVGGV